MDGDCPLCDHPYAVHDFDIHNADLGFFAGFPFELMCYDCFELQMPRLGTPEHDHVALVEMERSGHYCHIGPLPRWRETSPNRWEPFYEERDRVPPAQTSTTVTTQWHEFTISMS